MQRDLIGALITASAFLAQAFNSLNKLKVCHG